MSSTAAVAAHGAHAEHHELSFLRTYIFSEDHKMIGRQFLFMALFMMSIGGLLAILMGWAIAFSPNGDASFSCGPEPAIYYSAILHRIYQSILPSHSNAILFLN